MGLPGDHIRRIADVSDVCKNSNLVAVLIAHRAIKYYPRIDFYKPPLAGISPILLTFGGNPLAHLELEIKL
tara:strand:+ start:216 stop:428 length:213 start_codon:yes stop_codon:yes gene_type:complete